MRAATAGIQVSTNVVGADASLLRPENPGSLVGEPGKGIIITVDLTTPQDASPRLVKQIRVGTLLLISRASSA